MNKRRPGSMHGSRTAYGRPQASLFLPEIDARLGQIALISKILPRQYVDDSEMAKEEEASYGCLTDDKSR